MCSRFHISLRGKKLLEGFPGFEEFKEGEIRPGDLSPVLFFFDEKPGLKILRWGFRPEGKSGLVFNARSESAGERPMFKQCFKERRCIIPASWFYEWNRDKEKMKFEDGSGSPLLYLAGLWRKEEDGGRFVVLTTEANASMAPVHDRMPLLLKREELAGWCADEESAGKLLKKRPEELLRSSDYEQLRLF